MYEVGQKVYVIDVIEPNWECAYVSGMLFLAECNDYIIGCASYDCTDIDETLDEMYEESVEGCGTTMFLSKKEYVFENEEKANEYRRKMLKEVRKNDD